MSHPGFSRVANRIAHKTNPHTGRPYGKAASRAILAASTRHDSRRAKARNPRLRRVKGGRTQDEVDAERVAAEKRAPRILSTAEKKALSPEERKRYMESLLQGYDNSTREPTNFFGQLEDGFNEFSQGFRSGLGNTFAFAAPYLGMVPGFSGIASKLEEWAPDIIGSNNSVNDKLMGGHLEDASHILRLLPPVGRPIQNRPRGGEVHDRMTIRMQPHVANMLAITKHTPLDNDHMDAISEVQTARRRIMKKTLPGLRGPRKLSKKGGMTFTSMRSTLITPGVDL